MREFHEVKGTPTPLCYADGSVIRVGDQFTYDLSPKTTRREFCYPRYEVVFSRGRAGFGIRHIGGGRCSGSLDFKLMHNPSSKIDVKPYVGIGVSVAGRLLLWGLGS